MDDKKITRLPGGLERRKKDEDNYSWFIHKCACSTFFLRGDGAVTCTKCRKVIGTWELTDNGDKDPKKPIRFHG